MKKYLSLILVITIAGFLITLMVQDLMKSKKEDTLRENKENQSQVNLNREPSSIPMAATPTPIPTTTPAPTPTATPTPPSIGGKAMAYISSAYSVDPNNLKLIKYEKKEWPSSALGCPEPGKFYAQILTSGWALFFTEDNNQEYLIHTDENGINLVECTKILSIKTKNIVEILNITNTEKIVIRRLKDDAYFDLVTLTDQNEIKPIIQYLDIGVSNIEQKECVFLLELEFITKTSSQEINFVCADGSNFMKGSKTKLGNKIFEIPIELVNYLGKYAAQVSFPGIPDKPNTD